MSFAEQVARPRATISLDVILIIPVQADVAASSDFAALGLITAVLRYAFLAAKESCTVTQEGLAQNTQKTLIAL